MRLRVPRRRPAREMGAVGLFDEDGSEAETAARARLSRERAERRHAARIAEEQATQSALGAAQLARTREDYEAAVAYTTAWPARLLPVLDRLVEIDREVGHLVDQAADVTQAARSR